METDCSIEGSALTQKRPAVLGRGSRLTCACGRASKLWLLSSPGVCRCHLEYNPPYPWPHWAALVQHVFLVLKYVYIFSSFEDGYVHVAT